MRALLTASALLGLASCSAQQCDPARAGFLDGIGCEVSRGYIARTQAQQSALAQQNAAALTSRAQAQDEGARAGEAMLTRDQARQRLGAVDQQTARLRTQLASARARGGADQARLSAAQAELDALQRQRGGVPGGAATDDQVRALEARRRRLTDQLAGI